MSRLIAVSRRAFGALVVLTLLPSLAHAHLSLRRSDPARGSRLAVAPTRIALWFTARPQLAFSRLRLIGPSGDIALGSIVADTADGFHADIPRVLAPGEYRVEWQTASADGHVARGEVAFVVGGASTMTVAPLVVREQHAPVPESHEGRSAYQGARWMEFVSLLVVLGALGFRHGVLPPLAARGVPTSDAGDRARRLGRSFLILYAVAACIRLYDESVAVHGTELALAPAELLPMVTSTLWGAGWALGLVGALALFLGWTVSPRSVVIGTPLALAGGFGMAMSPALSGHAASSRYVGLSIAFDVLHVTAASVWLGGLFMVLVAGMPAMRRVANDRDAVASLVNSFHPVALFCAPIVVIAGLGTTWLRVGAWSAMWGTPYGKTLLLKLGFFLLVAGMGAYNWLRARRRLNLGGIVGPFRVTASIELLFAAVILAVTTVLVTTPVPTEMIAHP